MQYLIRHNFNHYKQLGATSAVMYHNNLDPTDDRLYISFYKWAHSGNIGDLNGTLFLIGESEESTPSAIDGVEVLTNNSIFATPYYLELDVTEASTMPAVIDSRPVHKYNLVHFSLDAILEVDGYASGSDKFKNRNEFNSFMNAIKFRESLVGGEIAKNYARLKTLRSPQNPSRDLSREENQALIDLDEDQRNRKIDDLRSELSEAYENENKLYFTDTVTKFPSLRASVPYSPLDYFKTLEVNHQGTNDMDYSHRENLAANIGMPCPPRWNNGIALLNAYLLNNTRLIENIYSNPAWKIKFEIVKKIPKR